MSASASQSRLSSQIKLKQAHNRRDIWLRGKLAIYVDRNLENKSLSSTNKAKRWGRPLHPSFKSRRLLIRWWKWWGRKRKVKSLWHYNNSLAPLRGLLELALPFIPVPLPDEMEVRGGLIESDLWKCKQRTIFIPLQMTLFNKRIFFFSSTFSTLMFTYIIETRK